MPTGRSCKGPETCGCTHSRVAPGPRARVATGRAGPGLHGEVRPSWFSVTSLHVGLQSLSVPVLRLQLSRVHLPVRVSFSCFSACSHIFSSVDSSLHATRASSMVCCPHRSLSQMTEVHPSQQLGGGAQGTPPSPWITHSLGTSAAPEEPAKVGVGTRCRGKGSSRQADSGWA